jgi:menaquinone-dependent protoporphyrinogen IX oxidase
MRALVVYESMYGNTHGIAGNIADGLRSNYEVTDDFPKIVTAASAFTSARGWRRIRATPARAGFGLLGG